MYWHQKASMVCDTQAHLNTLTSQIQSWLSGKSLREPADISQNSNQGHPACVLVVNFLVQADADQAWTFVKNAQTNAWIIPPSFASYASFNDDGTLNTLIERIDW